MVCRGFFEWVLKLLNLVVMVVGLAMVGYGTYLLVMWLQVPPPPPPLPPSPAPAAVALSGELMPLGRPLLLLVDAPLSDATAERLYSAWFIFTFIGVGVILFITSIFGCAGARNGCCLSIYSFLIILFILVELAAGGFIFFNHSWKEVIPVDKTGNFDMMYSFLKENWRIAKWVALGAVIFEALLFTVAIIVQSGNQADYDSDDEYIGPRSGVRQPLVNQQDPADPRVRNLDYRPIRNDAWSQRLREKYGVDNFDPNRFGQATISPAEQRNRCTIL
ncbi:tobamovirus multiplication protein 2A-like [Phragmites australis]|uniref:tobamovirus multiplication protein 2A-like n=1 Tax=Phragmites australis TaxID=29695 RepID=UPI002D7820B3|nr:tobamovirus multiplication protein 2A-like [Phragmites australis]